MSRFLVPLIVAALWGAGPAYAQCESEPEPADSVRSVARAHYTDGVAAAQREDWESARLAFQSAYDVAPFAPIVYNLATAQAETGRLVAAAENYRRFLRRCSTEDSPETRADANELLGQLQPRIGRARVDVVGLGADDTVELDEVALSRAMLIAPIPVDPGSHDLVVMRRGEEVGRSQFRISEGGQQSVSLQVPEDTVAPSQEPSGGGGIDTGVLAAVLVVVGLAVAAGILIPALVLTSGSSEEPQMGTWAPVRLPLVRF